MLINGPWKSVLNNLSTSHYEFNNVNQDGAELENCLKQLALAWDRYARIRGILIEKKVTGAMGNAIYAEIAIQYGFADNATASASFGEIDSAFGNGNASITQMLNRHL